ncbi:Collagen alpha-1(II) chain-like [Melia azedarach]|uniref:Collagen alpha-1(II) chain-like n=1 Tax=Melia azedarach TaxID=155640 RepID=A0ACC1YTS4_MELAZ|nr:Collagen alpha-1(II) chain-like [Melia azedarach]
MQCNEALRILNKEEEKYWKPKGLVLESLPRGPTRPPGNGCTYIPGRGGAPCTNQMNFAGLAMPPPPVYPDRMIDFGGLQSLQRGPVPPSGNGCTYIPGRGGRHCTDQMNFAAHVMPPPPPPSKYQDI